MAVQSNDDLYFAPLRTLRRLLRAKKISSVELTRSFLSRLETIGPQFNALAELTPQLALEQARRADRQLRQLKRVTPLTGIPYGAKDLFATKGIPTRWGAPPLRDQVFDYDATVVRRLRDAGAVLIGKLAMIELAGGGAYDSPAASMHGPGLNAWNRDYWSGGSSSGSVTAVAAGLAPFALGTETWGSISSPCAYSGVTGLRPTWGLVSRFGAMELGWSLDKVGPIAHTAEDCGWILEAMAGADPDDSTTAGSSFRFSPRRSGRVLRLGVLPVEFQDESDLYSVFERARKDLRRAGIHVQKVALPDLPFEEIGFTLFHAEAGAALESFIKSERVDGLADPGQIAGLKRTLEIPASQYVRAMRQRHQATVAVRQLFKRVDALLTPAVLNQALPIDTNLKARFLRRGGYSVLGAICGIPSLTVPMGFSPKHLPYGLSIIGDLFAENTILQIGMMYQRETDWHLRRPPALR